MNLDRFHEVLASSDARGYPLNGSQREAVDHEEGPLWMIAGPGSGKSEALVTRTLKLLCVDGVDPGSALVTTFTVKAARNLEDRLATYLLVLQRADPSLAGVDLADMRIGTLHSLCNDILQEYRYPVYQNVRLLDDVEQHLFLYRHAAIVECDDVGFWTSFEYAVSRWRAGSGCPPNKWKRAKAAAILLNHIVEDRVDLDRMRAAGGAWTQLADFYLQYAEELRQRHRCDYAHLQSTFLEFLNSPASTRFMEGDAEGQAPLRHVLVDEYQDTNPIQEHIYLALARRAPHNLVVVGDDDQALYRFRGGTVACMVHFNQACQVVFGVQPHEVQLLSNYRSHPDIVEFFNDYIVSFPEMNAPDVRAPGKRPVESESDIAGDYPAVSWLSRRRVGELPEAVADLVQEHLIEDGIIEDLSQCVLLLRSAKDSPRNAGPFLEAFRQRGIPVYNPRSKAFMESEEVQCLLAVLIHVIDQNHTFQFTRYPNGQTPEWVGSINQWIQTLDQVVADPQYDTEPLSEYVERSNEGLLARCQQNPGSFLDLSLLEIFYRILSFEPFQTWRQDLERSQRLAKVTRLFESYHSFNLDALRSDDQGNDIAPSFLNRLYHMFIGYLTETGIDDDEDEDVIVPQGYLPVMTIHQSKGLEFPFVIVAQLGGSGFLGASQVLERELAPFRRDLYPRPVRDPNLLVIEDDVRLFYVAYSRAEYAMILVGTQSQLNKGVVSIPGRNFTEFRRNIPTI